MFHHLKMSTNEFIGSNIKLHEFGYRIDPGNKPKGAGMAREKIGPFDIIEIRCNDENREIEG